MLRHVANEDLQKILLVLPTNCLSDSESDKWILMQTNTS